MAGLTLPANQEIVLGSIRGDAIELMAEIETNDAPLVELNVLRSPGKEEYTRIAFYRERGFRDWERYNGWQRDRLAAATDSLISIDSSYSSTLPDVRSRAPETGPVFLERDEPLRLRVFVDRSVVEVFVNGKQCVAMRVYPGREDSVGVSLRSQGRTRAWSRWTRGRWKTYMIGLSPGGQDRVSLRHDYQTEVCRIPCQHAAQLHL